MHQIYLYNHFNKRTIKKFSSSTLLAQIIESLSTSPSHKVIKTQKERDPRGSAGGPKKTGSFVPLLHPLQYQLLCGYCKEQTELGVGPCLHPRTPFVSEAVWQRLPTELLELMKTDYNLKQSPGTLELSILKERYPAFKQNWSFWMLSREWEDATPGNPFHFSNRLLV